MKTKTATPVTCNCCGQAITDKTALENERKRLEKLAKEKAEEKALDKASRDAHKQIENAVRLFNKRNSILKLKVYEWDGGNEIKAPIEYLRLTAIVAGEECDGDLTFDDWRSIKSFFAKLDSPLM